MAVLAGTTGRRILIAATLLLLTGLLPSLAGAERALQQTGPSDPNSVEFELAPLVDGFTDPLRVTHAGDGSGRLFVVEKRGTIRIVRDGRVLERPFLDISERVRDVDGEQGLFGIAFHPDYAGNGQFFVVYTSEPDGANTLARFQVSASDPDVADHGSELVLFDIPDEVSNHNGGDLAFSPVDGYLYYATGDGGGVGDPQGNAQNPQALLGKMLRVDVDNGSPYAIPEDNPFVGDQRYRPEIWAVGFRNPWRFSFDRVTGDLYVGDVGQGHWEELDFQPASSEGGENYGWPRIEGTHCYPPVPGCDETGLTLPVLEYPQYEGEELIGCSIVAGSVYRGSAAPAAQGAIFYADWCSGRIWMGSRDDDGNWQSRQLADTELQITSIGEAEYGELYLTDMQSGTLYRVVLSAPNPVPQVTSVDPAATLVGDHIVHLNVQGQGFVPESVVILNDIPLETSYVNSGEVDAIAPSDLTTAPTVWELTVQSPEPGGGVSNAILLPALDADGSRGAFETVWTRTDAPVLTGAVARTWVWGPEPLGGVAVEPYAEAPGGWRTVIYYDKSRMELTNPGGDPSSPWYVTNGLLVRELMTGQLQVGDDGFEERQPAEINVAGDPGDPGGITYAALAGLTSLPAHAAEQPITSVVDTSGGLTQDDALADQGVVAGELAPETRHRVASVFWEFMSSSGPVDVAGQLVDEALFLNPYYATGLPVTEAYWAAIQVGGVERLVLIQAFERRVLTYTPDNPPGWRVEAGNVGRHYFSWRYQ